MMIQVGDYLYKRASRFEGGDASHFRKWLEKVVMLQDGEGSIDLGDSDPVFIGIVVEVQGYGPHLGAIYVDQNRYHASRDTALQGASEIFDEWRLNDQRSQEYLKELEEEWGEEAFDIMRETDDGMTWELSPQEAADAIRGTEAAKYVDIYEAEEEEDYE
jgi:hypothetical protein